MTPRPASPAHYYSIPNAEALIDRINVDQFYIYARDSEAGVASRAVKFHLLAKARGNLLQLRFFLQNYPLSKETALRQAFDRTIWEYEHFILDTNLQLTGVIPLTAV
jgi:hypothetical protein